MFTTNESTRTQIDRVVAALLGHAIGDALGVPVEFRSRVDILRQPVTDLQGYGTHHQPRGTWSDDTSLTLCTAEALCEGYDLRRMGQSFTRWLDHNHWTPHGEVFDIGMTTRAAIGRLRRVEDPRRAGPRDLHSNGNGSLMRILPLALYLAYTDTETRQKAAMEASCLTHAHPRSQLACAFYAEVVSRLVQGAGIQDAYEHTRGLMATVIERDFPDERLAFALLLDPGLADRPADKIDGSGYVLHTLAASLWCCLNTASFQEAVLRAVNLGEDTDTTGAVTGGLAAVLHGPSSLPERWLHALARYDDIRNLYGQFADACVRHWQEISP
jgi:ADP-ribosylglycohydrolase